MALRSLLGRGRDRLGNERYRAQNDVMNPDYYSPLENLRLVRITESWICYLLQLPIPTNFSFVSLLMSKCWS